MILDPLDTIAAVASPAGPACRGLIRLSGPRAWDVARRGFAAEHPPSPGRPSLISGRLTVAGLRTPLPAAVAFWPAPRTYTGQELAEIHTIGSPPLLDRVLAQCLAQGARLAEPGEFTFARSWPAASS